jgi:thioredoxin-related protein
MGAGKNPRVKGTAVARDWLRRGLLWTLLMSSVGLAADTPLSAQRVLAEAEAQAAAQHKNVFLIFGASWCGWCRKLDAFNEIPSVKAILEKNFVTVHLDVGERGDKVSLENPGAEELERRLGGEKNSLPFFAFLDPAGHLLVNSYRPVPGDSIRWLPRVNSNIGFPGTPEEIDWFIAMLRKSARSFTPDDARVVENQLGKRKP